MNQVTRKRNFIRDHVYVVLGILVCVIAVLVNSNTEAENLEELELTYRGTPLAVDLQVNIPFELRFGQPVELGVPHSLSDSLAVENIASTVYLTAIERFEATKVVVKLFETNQSLVLSLHASNEPTEYQTVRIRTRKQEETNTLLQASSPVALTRFAAQKLFAPSRLVPEAKGLIQIRIDRAEIALSRDPDIVAIPLGSWKAESLFVTAIELSNQSSEVRELDPEQLRGDWLTATFHHARLLPHGAKGDQSIVYLVSSKPFHEALEF